MRNCGGDVDAFAEADAAFHFALGQAANNEVLLGILNSLRSLLAVWIRRVVATVSDTQALYEQHLAIFQAVQERDAEKAVQAMEAHLKMVTVRLLEGRKDGNEG
jgi:GntR family transcriptional repressor for pyruvate dehydrogenase complex